MSSGFTPINTPGRSVPFTVSGFTPVTASVTHFSFDSAPSATMHHWTVNARGFPMGPFADSVQRGNEYTSEGGDEDDDEGSGGETTDAEMSDVDAHAETIDAEMVDSGAGGGLIDANEGGYGNDPDSVDTEMSDDDGNNSDMYRTTPRASPTPAQSQIDTTEPEPAEQREGSPPWKKLLEKGQKYGRGQKRKAHEAKEETLSDMPASKKAKVGARDSKIAGRKLATTATTSEIKTKISNSKSKTRARKGGKVGATSAHLFPKLVNYGVASSGNDANNNGTDALAAADRGSASIPATNNATNNDTRISDIDYSNSDTPASAANTGTSAAISTNSGDDATSFGNNTSTPASTALSNSSPPATNIKANAPNPAVDGADTSSSTPITPVCASKTPRTVTNKVSKPQKASSNTNPRKRKSTKGSWSWDERYRSTSPPWRGSTVVKKAQDAALDELQGGTRARASRRRNPIVISDDSGNPSTSMPTSSSNGGSQVTPATAPLASSHPTTPPNPTPTDLAGATKDVDTGDDTTAPPSSSTSPPPSSAPSSTSTPEEPSPSGASDSTTAGDNDTQKATATTATPPKSTRRIHRTQPNSNKIIKSVTSPKGRSARSLSPATLKATQKTLFGTATYTQVRTGIATLQAQDAVKATCADAVIANGQLRDAVQAMRPGDEDDGQVGDGVGEGVGGPSPELSAATTGGEGADMADAMVASQFVEVENGNDNASNNPTRSRPSSDFDAAESLLALAGVNQCSSEGGNATASPAGNVPAEAGIAGVVGGVDVKEGRHAVSYSGFTNAPGNSMGDDDAGFIGTPPVTAAEEAYLVGDDDSALVDSVDTDDNAGFFEDDNDSYWANTKPHAGFVLTFPEADHHILSAPSEDEAANHNPFDVDEADHRPSAADKEDSFDVVIPPRSQSAPSVIDETAFNSGSTASNGSFPASARSKKGNGVKIISTNLDLFPERGATKIKPSRTTSSSNIPSK